MIRTEASKVFHDHLDKCEQCREHPFALCKIGHQLLTMGRLANTPPTPKRWGEPKEPDFYDGRKEKPRLLIIPPKEAT